MGYSMGIKFSTYNYGYQIVSLALCEDAKNNLLNDNLKTLFVTETEIVLLPNNIVLSNKFDDIEYLKKYNNYDVLEIWNNGTLIRKYNDKSTDNYFFVTSGCNSNCIMCPSPEASRRKAQHTSIEDLCTLAKHIPSDAPHLTITGGEPFLVGEGIFDFIKYLKERFTYTEFLLLTNGRIFSVPKYVELLKQYLPQNSIVAIPLHGSCDKVHDNITRARNSFVQTRLGIKNLLKNHIRVELRVVVSKLNVANFGEIAEIIHNEFSGIQYVSIIAMEMTGSAKTNKDHIWLPYKEVFCQIKPSVRFLIENGIDVRLYNFPLCTVDSAFWTICEKSISENKVKYAETCDECKYKKNCGGVFTGTFYLERDELKAIL